MKIQEIKDKLIDLAALLVDADHELLKMADETDNHQVLLCVAQGLLAASNSLNKSAHALDTLKEDKASIKDLEAMAILAEEFDKSGDPLLMKQASVLDQILLTIGASKEAMAAFKMAEDKEIERLREKYRYEAIAKNYKEPKEKQDKKIGVAESVKAIDEWVKEYRPNEAPLSTRTCPEHPGAQMQRVADYTFQCDLDKKIYNFQVGYTTMKNNKVPGGDVALQSQSLNDGSPNNMAFDSREQRLNG